MGETRKQVTERRIHALEEHVKDLEVRLSQVWTNHLLEFHPGEQGVSREPEE